MSAPGAGGGRDQPGDRPDPPPPPSGGGCHEHAGRAPIPTSGYNAWFLAATGDPFALPVVCLIPHAVAYHDGDELIESIEYGPAVLSPGGLLTTLYDAEAVPPLLGGVAPAHLDQAAALAWLETSQVMPHGPDDAVHLADVDDPELPSARRLRRRLASV